MQSTPAKVFDAIAFLASLSPEKKIVSFFEKQVIFSQGEQSNAIFYIEKGAVKLTVTSRRGKEAILAVLSREEFFGESCIASHRPVRFHNAVALTEMRAVKIERSLIVRALVADGPAGYGLLTCLLERNARLQDNLINSLMSSSEERLARILVLLSQPRKFDLPSKLTQQTLAEMIGTTRQRVNVLMNRFKNSGLIEYANGLKVHNSLRRVFRND
jgi:CRP-like cAMP-binding protein